MTEMLDIFDANHMLLGTCEKVAAHQQGLWHQTFHCWIVNERAGTGHVLLQLRSATKSSHPNLLDISAAGHLQTGEAPLDGLRELREELGVDVDPAELVYLGVRRSCWDQGALQNREFAHVYLLRDDRPLEKYTFADGEVSALVEISIADALALVAGEVACIPAMSAQPEDGEMRLSSRSVTVADLVPQADSYYEAVLVMAELYLRGAKYLGI